MASPVAVRGEKLKVEWAIDSRKCMPALEYFKKLEKKDQRKMISLFKRLADHGTIVNRKQFKSLGERGGGLWEFKDFQQRFLGDFRPGGRFVVAHGLQKQQDDLDPNDIARAKRILGEHDEREEKERQAQAIKAKPER
jgi:hypothetical protein